MKHTLLLSVFALAASIVSASAEVVCEGGRCIPVQGRPVLAPRFISATPVSIGRPVNVGNARACYGGPCGGPRYGVRRFSQQAASYRYETHQRWWRTVTVRQAVVAPPVFVGPTVLRRPHVARCGYYNPCRRPGPNVIYVQAPVAAPAYVAPAPAYAAPVAAPALAVPAPVAAPSIAAPAVAVPAPMPACPQPCVVGPAAGPVTIVPAGPKAAPTGQPWVAPPTIVEGGIRYTGNSCTRTDMPTPGREGYGPDGSLGCWRY